MNKTASVLFFVVALSLYLTAFLQPDARSFWAAAASVFLVFGMIASFRQAKSRL